MSHHRRLHARNGTLFLLLSPPPPPFLLPPSSSFSSSSSSSASSSSSSSPPCSSLLLELFDTAAAAGVSVVVGGPYSSGILVTGADPADGSVPFFNYMPAPPDVRERARAIEACCARHGVTLAAAALQAGSIDRSIDRDLFVEGLSSSPDLRNESTAVIGGRAPSRIDRSIDRS